MKKFDISALFLLLLSVGLFSINSAFAQKAKIQWINTVPSVSASSLDIYVNGTLAANNLSYTNSTAIDSLTAGTYAINVNYSASADSGDQVIARFNLTLGASGNNLIMICGVDSTVNYASNPNGRALDLKLVQRKSVLLATSTAATSSVTILNGITDNSGITITSRPAGISATKLKFGDTTGNITPASVATVIDLKDTNGTILNSYNLPLNLYGKKQVTLFAAGFANPASNQNGQAYALYMTDTAGGAATKLATVSRVQFINNSTDLILDEVDIWVDNTKTAGNLKFRAATAALTVTSGLHDITITKKNSPDTTGSNVVYRISSYSFTAGKTYLGMLSGVVIPANYAVNPDAVATSLKLNLYDTYTESNGSSSNVLAYFFNGVPDAPARAISRNPTAPILVFNSLKFNETPVTGNLPTTSAQTFLEYEGTDLYRTYAATLTGFGGKVGVLFTSGLYGTAGNPSGSDAKAYGLYLATTDGIVTKINSVSSYIQFIHASADLDVRNIKLFLNGKQIGDTFSLAKGTNFIEIVPTKNYRVHLAPLSSTDTTTAFYNTTVNIDASKYAYAVLGGVKNPAGFPLNPDGINRALGFNLNVEARVNALYNSKNVDLMFYNGIIDAPALSSRGVAQTLYLAKGNGFNSFHAYATHSAFDDVLFDFNPANRADTVLFSFRGNFLAHKGRAGIVCVTGFFDSTASNKAIPLAFAVWPDGTNDNFTGIKNASSNSLTDITVYPVPASENLYIQTGKLTGVIEFAMTDLTGKLVIPSQKINASLSSTNAINVSSLNNGIYLLTLKSGNAVTTQKISINR